MKRVGNLYEKIYSMRNLEQAHRNAKRGKGWYEEVKMVDANPEKYLTMLQDMLINHTYHTSKYQVFVKHEEGKDRVIYKLPYFPDRVCQWALLQVIEPYLMKRLTKYTYSAIPFRGIHAALNDVQDALKTDPDGCKYCFKMDVNHYYPSINHDILKDQYRRIFKDPELLWLIDEIIDSISTGDKLGTGVPIGNYLSQWSGNLYLSGFDHWLKEEKHVAHVFRYMDDVPMFGATKEELHSLHDDVEDYLHDNLKLTIKKNWQIFPTYVRGVDFVGYRIYGGYVLLRKSTCKNFESRMTHIRRKTEKGQLMNHSEWCSIHSYEGWIDHCNGYRLTQKYIEPIREDADRYYTEVISKKGKGEES